MAEIIGEISPKISNGFDFDYSRGFDCNSKYRYFEIKLEYPDRLMLELPELLLSSMKIDHSTLFFNRATS